MADEITRVAGAVVTCEKGHKMYIVWVEEKKAFAFACDDCNEFSPYAASVHGTIAIKIMPYAMRRKV